MIWIFSLKNIVNAINTFITLKRYTFPKQIIPQITQEFKIYLTWYFHDCKTIFVNYNNKSINQFYEEKIWQRTN